VSKPLRVLIIEDSEDDALLLVRELESGGYQPDFERVHTPDTMSAALDKEAWDIVIADYVMPHFSGLEALKLLKEKGLDLPFIIVSGNIGEETAVEAMKAGAHDYLLKSNLKRFIPAIKRELNEVTVRRERKRAQEALKESEARFRSLFENVTIGLYRATPDGRIIMANPALIQMLGLSSFDELSSHSLEELGFEPDCSRDKFKKLIEQKGELRGLEATWTRRGKSVIFVRQSIKVIRARDGTVLHWEGTVEDITKNKMSEAELQRTLEELRKAFGATIQALTITVEMRDPYTAGHQRRVTRLARAIGTEMGLSHEQIDGIRMAGSVHDLGKISIPAEILSKPGRITEIEFTIIKTHPQIGYSILKTIEFPWPVAKVVLQHHERMNGSGYPSGLLAEDILAEAKVLGVADVVEAMTSHRPYRPAQGIDKALEEISQNRGILYDARVVDVCLKLFAEKRFKFE
jgi:PAS domain S-box-containing protein